MPRRPLTILMQTPSCLTKLCRSPHLRRGRRWSRLKLSPRLSPSVNHNLGWLTNNLLVEVVFAVNLYRSRASREPAPDLVPHPPTPQRGRGSTFQQWIIALGGDSDQKFLREQSSYGTSLNSLSRTTRSYGSLTLLTRKFRRLIAASNL